MKLGTKILLTIASTFLCLTAVLFFVSQSVILGSFKLLERERAVRNVERALSALDEEIASMSSLNLDWASWDDTYQFIRERSNDYITGNLNNETIAKQRLNLIIYVNESGKTVYAKALDHYAVEEVPFHEGLKTLVLPGSVLTAHKDVTGRVEGVIPFSSGILLVSSHPILTSRGEGPLRGSLIMGRYLDAGVVDRLSKTTHLPLSAVGYDDRLAQELKKEAGPDTAGRIMLRTGETIEGYGVVTDVYGKPAFLLRIELTRGMFQQGKAAVLYFILYLMGAAIVSALALLLVLKKSVLSRLSNLGSTVASIGRTGRLSERVAVAGSDELTSLSVEINRMLSSLEDLEARRRSAEEEVRRANDELEARVRERTAELQEANVELSEEISERKRIEDAMKEMIYHDYLTGLPNRMLFTDRLNQVIARRARPGENMAAVIFMDIDRFKVVNDSLGHTAGDELIKAVAQMLKGALREGDTVARIGGDEFTVLAPDIARPDSVQLVVERILTTIRAPVTLKGHEVSMTASVGVAVYPYDGADSVTLLKNADIAMYHAKGKGGDTYEMYNPEMARKALERLTIGGRLRAALERNEFIMYYQPQYDMRTGRITGSEALIRWRDPEKGLLAPASFIPIAEETGIIVPMGDWVARTACGLNKRLQDEGFPDLNISVNISARMFSEPDFAEKIKLVLADTGMGAGSLILEITESLLMANIVDASNIIKDLRDNGARFSIDDFGTGYSSLAYLKNLSINELKIDRSFIKDLTTDADDRLITTAIINLAHSMGLEVIAEGVETKEQMDFLVEHGCDKIQGFFFSRPLPEEAFIALLKKQQGGLPG